MVRKAWQSSLVSVVVMAFALASCAGPKGLVITGKTLEAISDQFVATSNLYNKLFDDGVIDRAEYDAYKEWGLKFQKEYPKAVDSYEIIAECTLRAIKTPEAGIDCGSAEEVSKVILAFKDQLLIFWIAAQNR